MKSVVQPKKPWYDKSGWVVDYVEWSQHADRVWTELKIGLMSTEHTQDSETTVPSIKGTTLSFTIKEPLRKEALIYVHKGGKDEVLLEEWPRYEDAMRFLTEYCSEEYSIEIPESKWLPRLTAEKL